MPFPPSACKCNGHADACHFDIKVWEASGNHSGGVCNDCQHNTEGQHCQRCKPGFYRDLRRPFSAPDACKSKSTSGYWKKLDLYKRDESFHLSHADPWERGHEILRQYTHIHSLISSLIKGMNFQFLRWK